MMKSAYELAMERLAKDDPDSARPLTDEQRRALAAIDEKYTASIAGREVFLQQKLQEAQARKDPVEAEKINQQIRGERQRLEEEREAEKEKIRREG